jgi:hypothetical protein
MGCSCECCVCGASSPISPLKPKRRRIHAPTRLGGFRSCASLASDSWESLNQIDLGVRACQLRAIRSAYSQIRPFAAQPGQDVHSEPTRVTSPQGNLNDVQVALQLIEVTLEVEAVGNVFVVGGSWACVGQFLEISLACPC